ncbi:MAG TPA: hypothetical protein VEA59_06560 [Patescibacteria group bacterium]|nr:hypothetical protein [Patescibacteria group bacterium]
MKIDLHDILRISEYFQCRGFEVHARLFFALFLYRAASMKADELEGRFKFFSYNRSETGFASGSPCVVVVDMITGAQARITTSLLKGVESGGLKKTYSELYKSSGRGLVPYDDHLESVAMTFLDSHAGITEIFISLLAVFYKDKALLYLQILQEMVGENAFMFARISVSEVYAKLPSKFYDASWVPFLRS